MTRTVSPDTPPKGENGESMELGYWAKDKWWLTKESDANDMGIIQTICSCE